MPDSDKVTRIQYKRNNAIDRRRTGRHDLNSWSRSWRHIVNVDLIPSEVEVGAREEGQLHK